MKKKIVNVIIAVLIVMIFAVPSYAENKTENTTASKSQTKTTNTTANNTSNKNKISSNTSTANKTSNSGEQNKATANSTSQSKTSSNSSGSDALKNLGITPHDFSGFSETKTEYQVTIPSNITEVEVYATPKDSQASVTGTGKVKLQDGDNVQNVVVTSTKGTSKTYTITIKKLKVGETNTTTLKKSELALESLEITGVNLEPSFNKDVYQYSANYEGSEKSLNINTKANKANALINIIGNENLINGKNVVTIILTDEKESEVSTYQIYINKNIVAAQELENSFNEANLFVKIKIWAQRILIVLIVTFVILLIVLIRRRTKNSERKKAKAQKKLNKIIWKNGQRKLEKNDNNQEIYKIHNEVKSKDNDYEINHKIKYESNHLNDHEVDENLNFESIYDTVDESKTKPKNKSKDKKKTKKKENNKLSKKENKKKKKGKHTRK